MTQIAPRIGVSQGTPKTKLAIALKTAPIARNSPLMIHFLERSYR